MNLPRAIESPTAESLADKSIIELAQNVYNNALAVEENAAEVAATGEAVNVAVNDATAAAERAETAAEQAETAAERAETAAERAETAASQPGGGLTLISHRELTFNRDFSARDWECPFAFDSKEFVVIDFSIIEGGAIYSLQRVYFGGGRKFATLPAFSNFTLHFNPESTLWNMNVSHVGTNPDSVHFEISTEAARPPRTNTLYIDVYRGTYGTND